MKRILVVEDNAELAKLVELILRRAQYDITLAEDGQDALVKFQRQPPDLVLLDIMLPQMDGYRVCGHIRREFHSDVPVVMLSSLDSPLDIERSRECGATDHITKPFDKEHLLSMLAGYLETPEKKTA